MRPEQLLLLVPVPESVLLQLQLLLLLIVLMMMLLQLAPTLDLPKQALALLSLPTRCAEYWRCCRRKYIY
jgi:hypothetical protein